MMFFLGYPIDIWLAVLVAVMIKLRKSTGLTWTGYILTSCISILSGIILYEPIIELFALSPTWQIPVAILIGLTSEDIMTNIMNLSKDIDFLKTIVEKFVKTKRDDS